MAKETPQRKAQYEAVLASMRINNGNIAQAAADSGVCRSTVRNIYHDGWGPWAPSVKAVLEAEQRGTRAHRSRFMSVLAEESAAASEDASQTRNEEAILVALLRRSAIFAAKDLGAVLEVVGELAGEVARQLAEQFRSGEIDAHEALKIIKGLVQPVMMTASMADTVMALERRVAGAPEASMALVLADGLEGDGIEVLERRMYDLQARAERSLKLIRGGKA